MIKIEIDNTIVQELLKESIEAKVSEHSTDLVFWDSNELKRRTCMRKKKFTKSRRLA